MNQATVKKLIIDAYLAGANSMYCGCYERPTKADARDWYDQEYLTPVGKVERIFNDVVAGDGWLSLPINKIGTGTILLANSTNAKIRITTSEPATVVLGIGGSFKCKFE
jgi:hypothetical protein